jgi:hypothetical protein
VRRELAGHEAQHSVQWSSREYFTHKRRRRVLLLVYFHSRAARFLHGYRNLNLIQTDIGLKPITPLTNTPTLSWNERYNQSREARWNNDGFTTKFRIMHASRRTPAHFTGHRWSIRLLVILLIWFFTCEIPLPVSHFGLCVADKMEVNFLPFSVLH